MKRFTVAQLRERLAEALNEAERGVPVAIERRGVRYLLRVERRRSRRRARRPILEILDPAVAAGDWLWSWNRNGVQFHARRPRR